MSAKLFHLRPCLNYRIATSAVTLDDSTNIENNKLSRDFLVVYTYSYLCHLPPKNKCKDRQAYADLVQFKRLQRRAVVQEQQQLLLWKWASSRQIPRRILPFQGANYVYYKENSQIKIKNTTNKQNTTKTTFACKFL